MKWRGKFRFFVLLLAIAAVLGVATATASPAHFHANPPSNGCDLCFAAHVASLEAANIAAATHTPLWDGHITLCSPVLGYQLFRSKASLTRGPPSFFVS
jgi:hypothetical protein